MRLFSLASVHLVRRVRLLVALLGFAVSGTAAGTAGNSAEYERLSEELARLATKNAWVGAERAFVELRRTGAELAYDDWLRGAQSARAQGDIASTRERLQAATAIRDDRQIIDLLWQIDQRYGAVLIRCDPDSYLTLSADPPAAPSDPDVLRAIEFAKGRVHAECRFDGLLPLGEYHLHDRAVTVEAHRPTLDVDLRGEPFDRKERKQLREQWEREQTATDPGTTP
jgi:hypothetical protein